MVVYIYLPIGNWINVLLFPMLYLGRAHALASICTVFRCITKVFVSSNFWGVTSWYQSFSLSELSIDDRIPRLKLDSRELCHLPWVES